MIYASYSKLPKNLKNGIGILVGWAVFKLWIKTVKMLFGSITQEPLDLPNFHAIFEFLGQLTAGCIHYPKIKLLIILRFEIFIHMPILSNNYICPKLPSGTEQNPWCTRVWSEVKSWSFKGFYFCFVLFSMGMSRAKPWKGGLKKCFFSFFFSFLFFFFFFFFAEVRSVVVY